MVGEGAKGGGGPRQAVDATAMSRFQTNSRYPDHEFGLRRFKASYASAVKGSQQASADLKSENSCGSPISLEFINSNVENGRIRVKPPQGITVEGCSIWKNTLVGYFEGQRLAYPVVINQDQEQIPGDLGPNGIKPQGFRKASLEVNNGEGEIISKVILS